MERNIELLFTKYFLQFKKIPLAKYQFSELLIAPPESWTIRCDINYFLKRSLLVTSSQRRVLSAELRLQGSANIF